ncbi:MAG: hypothetical protein ACFFBD_17080 [Candidatus Hodarchaeota archaeon]
MGFNFGQLVNNVQRELHLQDLIQQPLGIAAYPWLFAFLDQIKVPKGIHKGEVFRDETGNVTSHLIGLFNLCIRLLSNHLRPVFIFEPYSCIKSIYSNIQSSGTFEANEKLMEGKMITPQMLEDSFILLDYFGIPYLKAPGKVDAQGAWMTANGDLWAYISTGEALLYGASRVIQTFSVDLHRANSSKRKKSLLMLSKRASFIN